MSAHDLRLAPASGLWMLVCLEWDNFDKVKVPDESGAFTLRNPGLREREPTDVIVTRLSVDDCRHNSRVGIFFLCLSCATFFSWG